VVLLGNTSVSNFSTPSSFRIRKSIGPGDSSRSSQVFGSPSSSHAPPMLLPLLSWSSSRCSVTATPIPLLPTLSAGTLLLPPRGRSSVAIQKSTSVMPVLLAVPGAALAHPPATLHQSRLHTPCHPAIGHRSVPRQHSGVQVLTLTS